MRTTAERYIDATAEATEKLARRFECKEKTIYLALTYRNNSELSRKIRYVAVKFYGAIPMLHVPECDTLHETSIDGKVYMRQTFLNGAVLLWEKGSENVTVRFRSKEEHFTCDSLPRFTEIQLYAEGL